MAKSKKSKQKKSGNAPDSKASSGGGKGGGKKKVQDDLDRSPGMVQRAAAVTVDMRAKCTYSRGTQKISVTSPFLMVETTADFLATRVQLDPTNTLTFGPIAGLASNFEKYRIRRLRLVYEPDCPSTVTGSISFAHVSDPMVDGPTSTVMARSYETSAGGSVTLPHSTDIEFEGPDLEWYYTRSVAGDETKRYQGAVFICTEGGAAAAATAGLVWIEADIEFLDLQPANGGAVLMRWTNPSPDAYSQPDVRLAQLSDSLPIANTGLGVGATGQYYNWFGNLLDYAATGLAEIATEVGSSILRGHCIPVIDQISFDQTAEMLSFANWSYGAFAAPEDAHAFPAARRFVGEFHHERGATLATLADARGLTLTVKPAREGRAHRETYGGLDGTVQYALDLMAKFGRDVSDLCVDERARTIRPSARANDDFLAFWVELCNRLGKRQASSPISVGLEPLATNDVTASIRIVDPSGVTATTLATVTVNDAAAGTFEITDLLTGLHTYDPEDFLVQRCVAADDRDHLYALSIATNVGQAKQGVGPSPAAQAAKLQPRYAPAHRHPLPTVAHPPEPSHCARLGLPDIDLYGRPVDPEFSAPNGGTSAAKLTLPGGPVLHRS